MNELKGYVISVIADYNKLDKELLGDTYEASYRSYLMKAVELLFKYGECDSERANEIRKYL